MQKIQEGISKAYPPGGITEFATEIYTLYDEFKRAYQKEWERIDDCEKIYHGDHWHDIPVEAGKENEPRPTTPIIFSTIENIRADLTDEFPEAIIKPEDLGDEVISKLLSAILKQNLEACDYDEEYRKLLHDLLVNGWMVHETGWDATKNMGLGNAFLRHIPNKNFMSDPRVEDIQDGRACFVITQLPNEWFRQHYPKYYPHMQDDASVVAQHHSDKDSTTAPSDTEYKVLIEAWFRFFDPKTNKHSVHMLKLAGGQVLENSYLVKPKGYFAHGEYPFVVTPLYTIKGDSKGLGIVDMFKGAQQYSDKVDQIILSNALSARHNRMFYLDGSIEPDDLADYSKEVVKMTQPPSTALHWMETKPLPSHILAFRDEMRNSIKEESGSNDFSRGNVSSGVTAASAITALQEMSSKRSRMQAGRIHNGFKKAIRQLLEVIREFDFTPRIVTVTQDGQPQQVIVSQEMYKALDNGVRLPIEYSVSIKTARETKFTKLSNNQLTLEFASMFQGQLDPLPLLENMDFDGKEVMVEKIRAGRETSLAAMQQQIEQLTQAYQQMQAENGNLKSALASTQNALSSMNENPTPTLEPQGSF